MFRFCSVFLVFLFASLIRVLGFISRCLYRSKPPCVAEENGSNFCANHSQEEDHIVSKNSTVFWSSGLSDLDLQKREKDCNENISDTESSDCLRCDLVANTRKYEFMSGKDVCGFFEEPKTESFVVQEMFVGSVEVLESRDQSVGYEIPQEEDSFEKSLQEFDEESDSCLFRFKLLDASCPLGDDIQGCALDETSNFRCSEKLNSADSEGFGDEGKGLVGDGILEEKDVSYEVELFHVDQFLSHELNQESDAAGDDVLISNVDPKVESADTALLEGYDSRNWMSSFLKESDQIKLDDLEIGLDCDQAQRAVDLDDDEYIELKPQLMSLTHVVETRISCESDNNIGGLDGPAAEGASPDGSQERKNGWDSDAGDDEADVLWEHQNLVQQMKMELRNCRIRSLPPISEEECETPAMVEGLKPLEIDQKIEYKDMIEEIQKFYKSYVERMRKLDILNYQTLNAISFLKLKVSEVFTAGMKRADTVPFTLPRIRPCKGQRIYADPMHKSFVEMHRDLELVYVGQLCLSWEILCWLYGKVQELLGYDSQVNENHSYNRAAEEFQQFQVLVQRFIEDEPFQGQRIENYVKSRCMIKSLLQIPTIKDNCSKRKEETDAVSLEMLTEIIRESMLIFREFLFADKRSTIVTPKGVQETRPFLQDSLDLKLLSIVITSLHKKARKIKEHIRSRNCIVKKLKKHQECRLEHDATTAQVELRLVSRVLSLSRLTTDQLVWCQNKLKNISFVGGKVHMDQSFLLFPC